MRDETIGDDADVSVPLKIVSWNVQANSRSARGKLAKVAAALGRHAPDVVVLQEVTARGDIADVLRDELKKIDLEHFHFSGDENTEKKKYGNVIASRWRLEPHVWSLASTWPQLIASATVAYPPGSVLVVGVHIPNGSNNGWEKVYALEALARGLDRESGKIPCILAGDFNEPRVRTGLSIGARRPRRSPRR